MARNPRRMLRGSHRPANARCRTLIAAVARLAGRREISGRAAGLAIGALLLLPTATRAATVSVGSDGVLLYSAAPGERNNPTFFSDPHYYYVEDSVHLTAGSGCTRDPYLPGVRCSAHSVTKLIAKLADGNDSANFDATAATGTPTSWYHIPVPIRIEGGAGADDLTGDEFAAKSPDTDLPRGPERLVGGAGGDILSSGVAAPNVLSGGRGGDLLYGDVFHGVASKAKLYGGAGGDDLYPEGHDVARGGRGADHLDATTAKFGETLYGNAGNDGFSTCNHHADTAYGGRGHDFSVDSPDPSDVLRSIHHPKPACH